MKWVQKNFLTIVREHKGRDTFTCVFPVINHEFRHNIVKVAGDPRGDSQFFDYNKLPSHSLPHRINSKFICLPAYWQWKLANERARISAVIFKKF